MIERVSQSLRLNGPGHPQPDACPSRRRLLQQFAVWAGLSATAAWPQLGLAQESVVLKVGFLTNYTPFSFSGKDGSLRGFDVDVVSRLATLMGVKVVPVVDTMANQQEGRRGKVHQENFRVSGWGRMAAVLRGLSWVHWTCCCVNTLQLSHQTKSSKKPNFLLLVVILFVI